MGIRIVMGDGIGRRDRVMYEDAIRNVREVADEIITFGSEIKGRQMRKLTCNRIGNAYGLCKKDLYEAADDRKQFIGTYRQQRAEKDRIFAAG